MKKKKSHFWASYADLMTSLFFLMVILFIICIVELRNIGITPGDLARLRYELDSIKSVNSSLGLRLEKTNVHLDSMTYLVNATQEQIDKVNEINGATENLNPNFFVYDPLHKKHKLNFDVKFRIEDDAITNISRVEREKLLAVGKTLETFVDSAHVNNPEVQYLLIIEGQASRDGLEQMDYNYDLSYRRAKNLKKYWDSNGILFDAGNCEVLISGSGDGRLSGTGLMRENEETANQRFLIHILPKPGQIE